MAQSQCSDGKNDKSELPCAQWDPVAQECLFVTQAEYSVVYYRVVFSHIDELENATGLV
jgi:hypothetical protein